MRIIAELQVDKDGKATRESLIALREKLAEQWEESAENAVITHIAAKKLEIGRVHEFAVALEFCVGVKERSANGQQAGS